MRNYYVTGGFDVTFEPFVCKIGARAFFICEYPIYGVHLAV